MLDYFDLPASPPTVENRTAIGVVFPMPSNTLAAQYSVIS